MDVNADGSGARQARSCKNIACRGGNPEILAVSNSLQRMDNLQILHHFHTVVANVWKFAVAYSRGFDLLDVSRA